MESLRLSDICSALGQSPREQHRHIAATGVSIDSRTVRPGDLFFALPGSQTDGHQFVPDALNHGAVAAIVDRHARFDLLLPDSHCLIRVENTLAALQALSTIYRSAWDGLIVGVTGSVGKTTTRHLIHSLLSAEFCGWQSTRNFNNEIGVPLSLFGLESKHEFAVVEMGATQRGDIRALCELASPEFAVITSIGLAHVESFGSPAALLEAKGELFEALPSTGTAFLPARCHGFDDLVQRTTAKVVTVGFDQTADLQAFDLTFTPTGLSFSCLGEQFELKANSPKFAENALLAIAIGQELGVSPAKMVAGLATFSPLPGRCQLRSIGSWQVLDDSYNASPTAVDAALLTLANLNSTYRVAILGDMAELGEMAAEQHYQIGKTAARLGIDRLLALGNHGEAMIRGAVAGGMPRHRLACSPSIEPLLAVLDCWLAPEAAILVKGSRVMQLERAIAHLEAESTRCSTQKVA
jgi:UDP-N-acetylmuramoyl-tripeptide--D-alanyl-D-alanine ligase